MPVRRPALSRPALCRAPSPPPSRERGHRPGRAAVLTAASWAAATVAALTTASPAAAAAAVPGTATQVRRAAVAAVPTGWAARRAGDLDGQLLAGVNAARRRAHLAPLVHDRRLTAAARIWSLQMVQTAQLSHDPGLAGRLTGGARVAQTVGTTLAVAPRVAARDLLAAYLASPRHRAILLDPRLRRVGVASVQGADGSWWDTVELVGRLH